MRACSSLAVHRSTCVRIPTHESHRSRKCCADLGRRLSASSTQYTLVSCLITFGSQPNERVWHFAVQIEFSGHHGQDCRNICVSAYFSVVFCVGVCVLRHIVHVLCGLVRAHATIVKSENVTAMFCAARQPIRRGGGQHRNCSSVHHNSWAIITPRGGGWKRRLGHVFVAALLAARL